MDFARSISIPISDPSGAGEARRIAAQLARALNFEEAQAGKAGIVVTEAATNIIKHAQRGEVLLRPVEDSGIFGLEMLALNRGAGMHDVNQCVQDGFSTGGTAGNGLGAISRLSSVTDLYSRPDLGTVLFSQIWSTPSFQPGSAFEYGSVCLSMRGETACGDIWVTRGAPGRCWIMVADGLGHGPLAARASEEAARLFSASNLAGPAQFLNLAHGPLRSTRGASVGVAEVNPVENRLTFSGVGNIAGGILDGESSRSLISHNGTLGHELHRIQEFSYAWRRKALLVIHSDGLNTRWNLETYPGLRMRHPAVIAGILYRDFARERDDVTVVVLRERHQVNAKIQA